MKEYYRHTQIGYEPLVLLLPMIVMWGGILIADFQWFCVPIFAFLAVFFVLFCTLTVKVSEGVLELRIGLSPIRKRFPLADIASSELLRLPWLSKKGIWCLPSGGTSYTVSGRHAVLIGMKGGTEYVIGTDQPEELHKVILDALQELRG